MILFSVLDFELPFVKIILGRFLAKDQGRDAVLTRPQINYFYKAMSEQFIIPTIDITQKHF